MPYSKSSPEPDGLFPDWKDRRTGCTWITSRRAKKVPITTPSRNDGMLEQQPLEFPFLYLLESLLCYRFFARLIEDMP